MGLDGKVILVTGGSSGIGADTALHLAKLGAKVSIVGRNEKRLLEVADQIKESGAPEAFSIVADVTKDAERIVNETVKHFGKIDVLVNSAGISVKDDTDSIDTQKFSEIIDTNVRSVITLTKLCLPYLEKTKGNIVIVSSLAGMIPHKNLLSYGMSKAALNHFIKFCAMDVATKGIRVNGITPAAIVTPMLTQNVTETSTLIAPQKYLLGRLGDVSDTSAAITFFANDETASFITGSLLTIDGGFSLA